MNCPKCTSTSIATTVRTEWFPYGGDEQAFQVTFPIMTCAICSSVWTDWRKEFAIEKAKEEYLTPVAPMTAADFSDKVRELLTQYNAGDPEFRETYREALLMLAAEL